MKKKQKCGDCEWLTQWDGCLPDWGDCEAPIPAWVSRDGDAGPLNEMSSECNAACSCFKRRK